MRREGGRRNRGEKESRFIDDGQKWMEWGGEGGKEGNKRVGNDIS